LKKKLFQNNGLEKDCIFHRPNTDPFAGMAVHKAAVRHCQSAFLLRLHHTNQGTHIAITAALVTACALGLMFSSTRWMGIAAAALLTAIHPIPSMAILILGLAIFYAFKH
jgi:ABC-type nitrate/sulfonate/bicarbonate transport system permease component